MKLYSHNQEKPQKYTFSKVYGGFRLSLKYCCPSIRSWFYESFYNGIIVALESLISLISFNQVYLVSFFKGKVSNRPLSCGIPDCGQNDGQWQCKYRIVVTWVTSRNTVIIIIIIIIILPLAGSM